MQPVLRPLLLLHPDEGLATVLSQIPSFPYRVQRVGDWAALGDLLGRSPPTTLAVVYPFGAEGTSEAVSEDLLNLLRRYPSATVVAALHVSPSRPEIIHSLLDWGVADWLDLTREDTPAAIARRLRSVWSHPVQRLLRRALPNGVPSRSRMLLSVAVEVVAAGGQAPEMASALGVAERTVPRWCERADLPPPRRLMAWLRLLLAADLLDDSGSRSIESIARATGYAGAQSLKTGMRNLMRMNVRELRAQGAFETVAHAFANDLFALREQARANGKPARTWLH
jgi:hypothetical protein